MRTGGEVVDQNLVLTFKHYFRESLRYSTYNNKLTYTECTKRYNDTKGLVEWFHCFFHSRMRQRNVITWKIKRVRKGGARRAFATFDVEGRFFSSSKTYESEEMDATIRLRGRANRGQKRKSFRGLWRQRNYWNSSEIRVVCRDRVHGHALDCELSSYMRR